MALLLHRPSLTWPALAISSRLGPKSCGKAGVVVVLWGVPLRFVLWVRPGFSNARVLFRTWAEKPWTPGAGAPFTFTPWALVPWFAPRRLGVCLSALPLRFTDT